jgi:hypothetical protein
MSITEEGRGKGVERMEEKQDRQKREEEAGEGGERDKGNKNREGGMEIHKPREKEKEISERRGNNNARMGRVLMKGRGEEGEAGTQMKEKLMPPEETEITADEVERQIRKLKKRKPPVRDGVQKLFS